MEYFYSEGGNNRPVFRYRIKIPKCTTEMYKWCEAFDDEGKYFRRWHTEWKEVYRRDHDVVQFEWYDAAVMFKLTWGGSDI